MTGAERVPLSDDLEAIRQLKARYFRTVDTKDWAGFRAVFTDDAQIGPVDNGLPDALLALRSSGLQKPAPRATGVDAFVDSVSTNMAAIVSTHHGHQSEIQITGDGEAEGIWAMEDVLVWVDEGYRFRGTGHYWETYRKVDGDWKIATLRLTRHYVYAEKIQPLA